MRPRKANRRRTNHRHRCAPRFTPLVGEHLEPRTLLAVTPQLLTDLNVGPAGTLVHGPIVWLPDNFGYFSGGYGANDYELWKTDGTQAGTVLVKDINPGISGSHPDHLTEVNGTLFFTADDGTNGTELWKSNGTTAGTV